MPRYMVTVRDRFVRYHDIEIEAEDESEANALAEARAVEISESDSVMGEDGGSLVSIMHSFDYEEEPMEAIEIEEVE